MLQKPDATWSLPAQREAILEALKLESDMLVLMKTGSGKSMIPIILSILEDFITVLILPLRSLMADYIRKLKDMHVPFEQYKGSQITEYLHGRHNLILVSADMARTKHWEQCIGVLHDKRPVVRFVFDEGHYAFTADDFRESLRDLHELRFFAVQLVVLTGTCPLIAELLVVKAFGLRNHKVFRTDTNRPELKFILETPHNDTIKHIKWLITSHESAMNPEDRWLLFVTSIGDGKLMERNLGYQFYHGDLDDTTQLQLVTAWHNGTKRGMICTSAFGAGNDYAHVRYIYHLGTPFEGIGYIQEVSRAGRDGQVAVCYIFPTGGSGYNRTSVGDVQGRAMISKLVCQPSQQHPGACLRYQLTQFCDGVGTHCLHQNTNQLCSACSILKQTPTLPAPFKSKQNILYFSVQ